jgi:hypothetical protein
MMNDLTTFNTPVLLLAWRRPHTTQQVINAIRAVKPTRMFVACDGPNPSRLEEAAKVRATREVIEREIDWPCTIERRYSEVNQGCKVGVSSAINWFFDQVEDGIILEDDCVPHPDFLHFCSTLLDVYRDDQRVWVISGTNFQNGQKRGDGSYYFSRYNHIWGWATWRRAWQHYERDMSFWPEWKLSEDWAKKLPNPAERRSWLKVFDRVYAGMIDTWDYQWTASVWYRGGLTATPNCNLVSNIGFGQDGAHTKKGGGELENMAVEPLGEIVHVDNVVQDDIADAYSFQHVFGGKYQGLRGFPMRVVNKITHYIKPF